MGVDQSKSKPVEKVNDTEIDVLINFCGGWGYYPRAVEAQNLIKEGFPNAKFKLEGDQGITGRLLVTVNGKVVHSKKNGDGFVKCANTISKKIEASL